MSAAVATRSAAVSAEMRTTYAEAAWRELQRRSLFEFVKQSWETLEPGTRPEWNWHIEVLCWHIQLMLEGWMVAAGHAPADGNVRQREIRARVMRTWALHGLTFREHEVLVQNAIFNLPPGTLKSRILMVCAPAWMWLHCPTWSVLAISAVEDNVTRDSNQHRELIESPWYRETFGITWKVHPKRNAVGNWETTAGGKRKSRTLAARWVGLKGDGIFLDDPDDTHTVFSDAKRTDTQQKWSRSVSNRLNSLNIGLRIAIQQRVKSDDWTFAQISKRGVWTPTKRKAWMWLVWPLQFGNGPRNAPAMSPFGFTDPRRVANENLHLARFSDEVIADELIDKGPDGFAAQYNQNPETLDGGLIKRSYFRLCRLQDDPVPTRPRPYGVGLRDVVTADEHVSGRVRVDVVPESDVWIIKRDPDTKRLDLDFLALSVDCSNGADTDTASATAILAIGGKGPLRAVLDDRSRVMGPLEMQDEIVAAVVYWEPDEVLIEDKALGKQRHDELEKAIRDGLRGRSGRQITAKLTLWNPTPFGGKEERARGMAPAWRAGFWHVREGQAWLYPEVTASGKSVDPGYVGEVSAFPKSSKNDRVDATSQAAAYFDDYQSEDKLWDAMSR